MQVVAGAFANKKVVILGLARQGLALARFFVEQGAQVVLSDGASAEQKTAEIAALASLPVEFALQGHPLSLLDDCALLCLSGGVPLQLEIVQTAIARGIPLSNDSLLTMQVARARGLGPIVGITGSSGKTTTTTLVGLMLAATFGNERVHVGGNIGTPLIDRMGQIQPGDPIVLELSSFQLELFDPAIAWGDLTNCGPDVAAILNITPNHLDRHAGMVDYAAAKFNLFRHLPANARVVLGADDPVTAQVAADHLSVATPVPPEAWHLETTIQTARSFLEASGAIVSGFSIQQHLTAGAWLEGETLIYEGEALCTRADLQLRGQHNVSNFLAAATISGAAGAILPAMQTVSKEFTGVPHRLEVVTTHDGVLWINDSIATSPERAIAALRSFPPSEQTLILLAGGKDKNLPWELFADEAIQRVNFLIGFGQAGAMIINAVQERARYLKKPAPNSAVVQRLDEAVELAARVGYANRVKSAAGRPHTVVLLSPGGTSYDAYTDFEARGKHFRQLVTRWAAEPVTV